MDNTMYAYYKNSVFDYYIPMLFEWFSMVPDSESGIVTPSTAWDKIRAGS